MADAVWRVYADGAARRNPGPAAAGVVIVDPAGRTVRRIGKALGERTNNQAEYAALLLAVRALRAYRPPRVLVTMDSRLVIEQMRGASRTLEPTLRALKDEAGQLIGRLGAEVRFAWVGRASNREADRLCNRALGGEEVDWAADATGRPD